jgi:hypothetical protein
MFYQSFLDKAPESFCAVDTFPSNNIDNQVPVPAEHDILMYKWTIVLTIIFILSPLSQYSGKSVRRQTSLSF